MIVDTLTPDLDVLNQEYLLVQAWKKTASYIRYHNWYADVLELDRTAVNLPDFLNDLSERLYLHDSWESDPLRIVPAPKSQQWRVQSNTKKWEPVEKGKTGENLRPLAYVSLKDQVAATAVMLCLADKIETLQGDPRLSIENHDNRRKVISYGNRLFCDKDGEQLQHRWGSAKLYRAYYQDYRKFLERPEFVAKANSSNENVRIVVVHSDLRQFYDRVRPQLLNQKIEALIKDDDPRFLSLVRRMFNWNWSPKDSIEVAGYANQAGISDFSDIAIPQGLVAAGFLANIVLLDFDESLRDAFRQKISSGIWVEDSCRYVDDLRIVLKVEKNLELHQIEQDVAEWLQGCLDEQASGLSVKSEKTKAALYKGNERLIVRQSRKMKKIQSAVSGGFDEIGGIEILDSIQGLLRSQERYSEKRLDSQGWDLAPIPDVRDDTVARFAAARYRSTYRSLRPLLMDAEELEEKGKDSCEGIDETQRLPQTKAELDDDVRAFALGLIENWVNDPSNVRLLRIGLDLWPAKEVIKHVFKLLRPFTEKGGPRKAPRRVAWYCLSEIFRAGATETGYVEDDESMSSGIDIEEYRKILKEEAIRLLSLAPQTLPWYLKQQIFLFLAVNDMTGAPIHRSGKNPETKNYRTLIRFLKGEDKGLKNNTEFAIYSILARRSFSDRETSVQLVNKRISLNRLERIAERDPSFALELIEDSPGISEEVSSRIRDDLCLKETSEEDDTKSLSSEVLSSKSQNPLRNELTLLRFAWQFLQRVIENDQEVITPSNIRLKLKIEDGKMPEVEQVKIKQSRSPSGRSMYQAPSWCTATERWRFQIGYLLRFILSATQDFTKIVRPFDRKDRVGVYRIPESHWFQRIYGLYNGRSAFGDDWIPVSDWIERLLLALLRWPGCRISDLLATDLGIEKTCGIIETRIQALMRKQIEGSLILPMDTPRPVAISCRPLRICIVQTAIPTPDDFQAEDLTLSESAIRRRHRNHLSSALSAVESMLNLRETHKEQEGRLDWLILPELSVHPEDIRTHLIPFARAHKTIVLAGLTYSEILQNEPYINSAIWIIPVWSEMHGLQIRTIRQGKQNLAPLEQTLNTESMVIQGFRPCQWLLGYRWSENASEKPLWLTASICYDATDLALVTALRNQSDVFAIPALNRDVTTFDQMALALHYHMFQMVIVVNNGHFGGSNAYLPYKENFRRQVIHLHGQPQATIAFLEIDDIPSFLRRREDARSQNSSTTNPTNINDWKFPPAGI